MAAKVQRKKKYRFFETCDNIEDLMRGQKFILQRLKKRSGQQMKSADCISGYQRDCVVLYTKLRLIS